jgi:hypothetical protein
MIDKLITNAHLAIEELVIYMQAEQEPKFLKIECVQPKDGQAVWVRNRNGAEYRMTYPFNHEDYPLWYPLPKD